MAESFTSQLSPVGSDTMFGPEALSSFGKPPAIPVIPLDLNPLKKIDSTARAQLGGFTEPTTEDAGGAKLIDLTAREKLGGFKNPMDEFDLAPPEADPISEFDRVDDLDARTVPELNKDRENFDPVSYFSNNPDVANDPAKLKKLLDIRRLREEEGLTAEGLIRTAKKGGPEVAKGFVPAAKQVVENIVDVTVQPVVNFTLGALTGDLQKAETRKALFAGPKKSLGELSAAAEATGTGMLDLARQAKRKIEMEQSKPERPGLFAKPRDPTLAPALFPKKQPKPLTDQEILAGLTDDVEFRRNAADILGGSGEGAKNLGLDAETLQKEGIVLDPKAVEAISLVEPLTMVAGAGIFKILGAGGKLIATARSVEAAEKLVDGLAKFTKTASTLKGVGKAALGAGEALSGRAPSALAVGHTIATGNVGLLATAIGAKYVAAPIAKKAGATMVGAGKVLAGELPAAQASAGVNRLAALAKTGAQVAEAGKELTKDVFGGAVKGAVSVAPFAAASYDDEQAGTLLGAGAILGAGAGAAASGGKAFRVVKNAAARQSFGPNRTPIPAVDSPGYGRVTPLDDLHLEQKKKLSTATANELDNFREGLRNQGREIYAVDSATFRQKAAERYKAQTGLDIDPALLDRYQEHHALFDETNPDGTKVVYLNADATGPAALQHDAGHLFDSLLAPEKITELNTAIDRAFPPEAIAEFKKNYEKRVGNKISEGDAKSEFRAEQFGAMFHNTPVSEMAAPKGLLKTFADVVAGGAEAMGVDISSGATTPNLGAPQKVGLRNMFESAARTVLEKGRAQPPTTPPTIPTVEPVVPPAPAPATRNIRVTPEQTAPLETSQTRAAAAERAKVTGITEARELAKKSTNPAVTKSVEDISTSMESGNPVVRIEHLGITSPGGPGAPEGAIGRKATREAGYEKLDAAQIEFRENAPSDIVSLHEKTFKPLRWDQQGGTPTLIAVSTDKLAANAIRIAKFPKAAGLHPYEVANGKFTDAGWKEVLADAQTFAENQVNGRKGDGSRLELPAEELGLSIPAENLAYVPKMLSADRANFQNAIQGVETPRTARERKGQVAGNIRGQLVAEANKRAPEIPANIPVKSAGKQAFASFPGRVVREVNPFRNELERRGFNTRNLDSAIERIRAQDIVKSEPRPEIKFSGMVTDISRAGFSPAPTEFRRKSLAGKTTAEFAQYVLDAPVEEWRLAVGNMTGGQTGGSINLALGLKDRGDLTILKQYAELSSAKTVELAAKLKELGVMNAPESLFTEMQISASKGMFFREAWEAAQGVGSMGAAFKRGAMGTEGVKVPFPIEETPTK